jgi:hypothetical protein
LEGKHAETTWSASQIRCCSRSQCLSSYRWLSFVTQVAPISNRSTYALPASWRDTPILMPG